tara:strand:- start:110 stop:1168 length:1059 start_codon:yes stop_codon:yes gene_type:complete
MFLIIIFFLELISFSIFKLNLLEISHVPKLYLDKGFVPNDEWWLEENLWGAWHKPTSSTIQKRSCFDVIYTSNEVGARDDSFKNNNDDDIILLGDSFAEGYGVNLENTSQKYIEKFTNRNVLNFGVSRNFGPLQYSIIYEHLAKNFKHKTILIYLLPDNDFNENDYSNWRGSKRYRPYYKLIDDNSYEIFIPKESVKNYRSNTKKLKKIFKDYLWTSNLFINIDYNYKIYRNSIKKSFDNFSSYSTNSLKQQKAVIHYLDKIIDSTSSNVILVSIPRLIDYDIFKNESKLSDIYWNNYYVNKDITNNNFKFIDLINYRPDNLNEIFLKCDGHWSTKGNIWAAKIISEHLNKK